MFSLSECRFPQSRKAAKKRKENSKKNETVGHVERKQTVSESAENPFPEPVEIEITDTIDLHAFSPRTSRR